MMKRKITIRRFRALLRLHDRLAHLLLGAAVCVVAGCLFWFTFNASLCALSGMIAGSATGAAKSFRDGFRCSADPWDFVFCWLGAAVSSPIVMLVIMSIK